MSGDLAAMPDTHRWFGSFTGFSVATGGSNGGGVITAVARRLVSALPRVEHVVVGRGRAHMLRLRRAETDEGLVQSNLRLEPAGGSMFAARRRLLDSVCRHMSGVSASCSATRTSFTATVAEWISGASKVAA